MDNPYRCGGCDGTGEMECHACQHEVTCDECHGSGLDDDAIDVTAFQNACRERLAGGSWALLEGDQIAGRTDGTTQVRYSEFARVAK